MGVVVIRAAGRTQALQEPAGGVDVGLSQQSSWRLTSVAEQWPRDLGLARVAPGTWGLLGAQGRGCGQPRALPRPRGQPLQSAGTHEAPAPQRLLFEGG